MGFRNSIRTHRIQSSLFNNIERQIHHKEVGYTAQCINIIPILEHYNFSDPQSIQYTYQFIGASFFFCPWLSTGIPVTHRRPEPDRRQTREHFTTAENLSIWSQFDSFIVIAIIMIIVTISYSHFHFNLTVTISCSHFKCYFSHSAGIITVASENQSQVIEHGTTFKETCLPGLVVGRAIVTENDIILFPS